jgi:hypothetical protein
MRILHVLSIVLALVLVQVADDACAARLSERSPLRLGLWYDPAQSGSGFEFFRAGDGIVLVWYTYRSDGSPVWYSASGAVDADGAFAAPLQRHRWVDGARGTAAVVGQVALQRVNFDRIDLRWQLDGQSGQQALQPFQVSGVQVEVDHSGAWYQPTRSGYGLGLTEQGDWLGAGLYFYDSQGEPTWRVGDNAGRGTQLKMRSVRGACPACPPATVTSQDDGVLSVDFRSERELSASYVTSTAGWNIAADLLQLSTPASQRPADRQLASFDGEEELHAYLSDAMFSATMSPTPTVDFSASPEPASATYSPTNVQEAGVDEADRLKTDGEYIYTFARDAAGSDRAAVRIAQASGDGAQLSIRNEVVLPAPAGQIEQSGMYLTDEKLLTLQGALPHSHGFDSVWMSPPAWKQGSTRATLLHRGSSAAPTLQWSVEFDSYLVASRRIGDRVYLVLRNTTDVPDFEYGYWADADRDARNRARLAATTLGSMMPKMRINGGDWQPLMGARDVSLPVFGWQQPTPQFISIVSIELDSTELFRAPVQFRSMGLLGSVDAVYVSPTRMYLATSRSGAMRDLQSGLTPRGFLVTDVHEIELGADGPRFAATGAVEGYLDRDPDRAPLRFSERDGKLRLVTVGGPWGELGQNRLTVLERSSVAPGLLRTLSYLPSRDRPAALGKPHEHLYGTRFVGDRLYAVTFLKTDPLYVVDLADPADPRIAGELELPGFSDYLHPVGDDLLLGIGLGASAAQSGWGDSQFAWFQGLQFSLFDVSNPAAPTLRQQLMLGKRNSYSAALRNHHALSVLPIAGGVRFALPVRIHDALGNEPPGLPDNYDYPWSWSGLQSIDVRGSNAADAQLVAGPSLVTRRRTDPVMSTYYDDALYHARSIQFLNGTIYVENGRFWRSEPDGAAASGPL